MKKNNQDETTEAVILVEVSNAFNSINHQSRFETNDKSIDVKNKIKATSTSTNNLTRIKKCYANAMQMPLVPCYCPSKTVQQTFL